MRGFVCGLGLAFVLAGCPGGSSKQGSTITNNGTIGGSVYVIQSSEGGAGGSPTVSIPLQLAQTMGLTPANPTIPATEENVQKVEDSCDANNTKCKDAVKTCRDSLALCKLTRATGN